MKVDKGIWINPISFQQQLGQEYKKKQGQKKASDGHHYYYINF